MFSIKYKATHSSKNAFLFGSPLQIVVTVIRQSHCIKIFNYKLKLIDLNKRKQVTICFEFDVLMGNVSVIKLSNLAYIFVYVGM